jgi:hypothetical protein
LNNPLVGVTVNSVPSSSLNSARVVLYWKSPEVITVIPFFLAKSLINYKSA